MINTVFNKPTYISNGCDLIYEAYDKYETLATENWPAPYMIFGDPNADKYYAEIWTSGMDYTLDFWIIESKNSEDPMAYPILSFDSEEIDKLNLHDLNQIIKAILWKKKYNEEGYFSDCIWPFLNIDQEAEEYFETSFEHASQPYVAFKIYKKK